MLTKPLTLQPDERIIVSPNLPENRVTVAAISETAGESIKKLNSLGIRTVIINANNKLNECVESHPDVRFTLLPNKSLFCCKEEYDRFCQLSGFNVCSIPEEMKKNYPHDVRLNCAVIGNKIICNRKTVSTEIIKFAESRSMNIINVNQGYSKCSVCIINENAIITDDLSIYRATQNFFNDVLLISKGSIGLKGADYGFIGGCTGKLDKNKLAFNGRIESHPKHNEIIDILNKYNTEPIELNSEKLVDTGGIIPLVEKTV